MVLCRKKIYCFLVELQVKKKNMCSIRPNSRLVQHKTSTKFNVYWAKFQQEWKTKAWNSLLVVTHTIPLGMLYVLIPWRKKKGGSWWLCSVYYNTACCKFALTLRTRSQFHIWFRALWTENSGPLGKGIFGIVVAKQTASCSHIGQSW